MNIFNGLIALASLAVTVAQPPGIELPPPGVSTPSASADDAKPIEFKPIEVEIQQGGRLIWRGVLRTGPGVGTSFEQTSREPYSLNCNQSGRFNRQLTNTILLRISEQSGGVQGRVTQVQFEWTRPNGPLRTDQQGCTVAAPDTLTARIQSDLILGPGQKATLKGDGDVVINLRRQ